MADPEMGLCTGGEHTVRQAQSDLQFWHLHPLACDCGCAVWGIPARAAAASLGWPEQNQVCESNQACICVSCSMALCIRRLFGAPQSSAVSAPPSKISMPPVKVQTEVCSAS